jgi:ATP-dependent Clp protease protease subunit
MKKFWNWIHNETGGRVLRLEGPIDSESAWGDEVTPKAFREELESDAGDITVWINSPGGNVFAAAEIYTMLKDYKGAVTVKIDAIAASAASVIAMAGNKVLMSPVAMLMIHDPSTIAMGNTKDMEKAIATLNEVKESIINAYAAKSGLSHSRISNLMSNETWLNAKKCVELGFADEILFEFEEKKPDEEESEEEEESAGGEDEDGEESEEEKKGIHLEAQLYSSRQMELTILNRLGVGDPNPLVDTAKEPTPKPSSKPDTPVIGMDGTTEDGSVPYLILQKQLECLR